MSSGGRTTLKDVAEMAGTSHVTVSRVLNSKEGTFPISELTRQRVYECVRELGYKPNAIARAMRMQKTGIVALVYCRQLCPHVGDDYFYMGVQDGIEQYSAENEYSLLVCDVGVDELEGGRLPLAIEQGLVDGVILLEIYNPTFVQALVEKNLPVATVCSPVPLAEIDQISQNNTAVANTLVAKVIELGHKDIVVVSVNNESYECRNRNQKICSLLEDMKLTSGIVHQLAADAYSGEVGELAVRFKQDHPEVTAFLCVTDLLAAEIVGALKSNGWNVPEDVSVTGCGGHNKWILRYTDLTTIHMDEVEMGREAARMILERINGDCSEKGQHILQLGRFIEGGTIGPVCI